MILQNYNLLVFGVTKPGLQNLLHGLLGSDAVRLTDDIYPDQQHHPGERQPVISPSR
jgi:hypothetical protein